MFQVDPRWSTYCAYIQNQTALNKHFQIRAAKTFWKTSIKETFCVDTSIHMNNLALALLEGGVRKSYEYESENETEKLSRGTPSTALQGLYFREFMPTSHAVGDTFVFPRYVYLKRCLFISRSNMILLFVHTPC